MASNTTASSNVITNGIPSVTSAKTDNSEHSNKDDIVLLAENAEDLQCMLNGLNTWCKSNIVHFRNDTFALIVILVTALVVLLLSCGGIIWCVLQKRKNSNSHDGQRGTILGHGGDEDNSHNGNSRESGGYRSYDAINLDMLQEIPLENVPDTAPEQAANENERVSRGSNVSGTYRSFDDFENILPDLNTPNDDSEMYISRVGSYNFEVPVNSLSDIATVQNMRQSLVDQADDTLNRGRIKRHNTEEKLRDFELFEQTYHEIDNPMFSEITYYEQ